MNLIPPQALEAESNTIGCMIRDNSLIDLVADVLVSSDFYSDSHALIFGAICDLHSIGQPVDVVTLSEHMAANKKYRDWGGMEYLGGMVNNALITGGLSRYCEIIKDKSRRRQLIDICQTSLNDSYGNEVKTESLIDFISTSIASVSTDSRDNMKTITEILGGVIDTIEERQKQQDTIIGHSTGLADLDEQIKGLQKGRLYTIAARPAMGKSCFAMNIAESVAIEGGTAAFFTMEMIDEEVGMRVLSNQSGVNHDVIQSANFHESLWPKLTAGVGRIAQKKMFIDDSTSLTIPKIKSRCRKLKAKNGLDVVVVDYLGLMEMDDSGNETREIAKITRGFKNLAKELDCAVVMLCQCNRDCEGRPDKRPILKDLRGSGAIEQDSNVVIFLYRDEVYDENTEEKGVAEIIVKKNRGGKIGTVRCLFKGEYQRFENFPRAPFIGAGQ